MPDVEQAQEAEISGAGNNGVLRLPVEELAGFAQAAFERVGVAESAARQAAETLLAADIRGISSHGVARLAAYISRIQRGLTDIDAGLTTLRETPVSLALDANNGIGIVLAPEAMRRTIAKAEVSGLCLTTVRHSNHFGVAGSYARQAAERGLGGMAMTNASPLVIPTFASKPVIGTNPLAIAVPTGDGPPLVLDMATSTVAWGKIEVARRQGKDLPLGWTVGDDGRATTSTAEARWLIPLGGDATTSGYKGFGLGVMVDVLCGPLAGAAWSAHVSGSRGGPVAANIGHTFMAWRIDCFREPAEFFHDVQAMIAELRATPPAAGHEDTGVLLPGDHECAAEQINRAQGIPLGPGLLAELRALAARLEIPFPSDAGER